MPTFTSFKGFDNISEPSLEQRLKTNLPMMCDWCFIDMGAFFNIRLTNTNQYGNIESKLKSVVDERFTNGRVWESARKNWVWESGVSQTTQPIKYSGVYVNNTFYPSNTSGTYAHYIDYPNGRVIFNNPIPTNSVVQCEYSYKLIQCTDINTVDYLKFIQQQSFRGDKTPNDNRGSGSWSQFPEQRIQLPAVVLEVSTDTSYSPFAIGSGAQIVKKTIVFHILGEEDTINSKIADILGQQKEKTFFLFDEVSMMSSGNLPLDYNGKLNSKAKTFANLVDLYPWNRMRIADTKIERQQKLNQIYLRNVVWKTETILSKV